MNAEWILTSIIILSFAIPGNTNSDCLKMFPEQSCTIIYASDGETALAGNNEDWNDLFPRIWFVPGKNGKFGRIYFGFNVQKYPQGGVNEKGLFFDAAVAEAVQFPPILTRSPTKAA
jgi:hypothetical protein